jgi:hypothetical protein
MREVLGEFKRGQLHSGSKTGPTVTSRPQAIAIALKQTGQSKYAEGGLVTHDYDKDLPAARDEAALVQMMPRTPPAYDATIQRLIEAQRQLNLQSPRRPLPPYFNGGWVPVRFWNGGWVVPRYWNGGWVW